MKTVAILQPSFMPWLGYFDQMLKSDVFVFYDDVQYDKNGWRNRNRVKNLKGEPSWLTVPVITKGEDFPQINSVKIDRTKKWKKQHLGSIRQFYVKAPFFNTIFPIIADVYESREHIYLIEIIDDFMSFFVSYLDIRAKLFKSSELGIAKTGRIQRIVDIAHSFSAEKYLSGSAAKDYLAPEDLMKHGIELEWHDYSHPIFNQLNGDFLSHLSIIDLIFNEGPYSKLILRGKG